MPGKIAYYMARARQITGAAQDWLKAFSAFQKARAPRERQREVKVPDPVRTILKKGIPYAKEVGPGGAAGKKVGPSPYTVPPSPEPMGPRARAAGTVPPTVLRAGKPNKTKMGGAPPVPGKSHLGKGMPKLTELAPPNIPSMLARTLAGAQSDKPWATSMPKKLLGPAALGSAAQAALGTGIGAMGQEREEGSLSGLLEQILEKIGGLYDIGEGFKNKFLHGAAAAVVGGIKEGKTPQQIWQSVSQHIMDPLREHGHTMDGTFWTELGHTFIKGLLAAM
jgi:hypothetical protein